ncbi:MAG: hypothetical protein ACK5LC_10435 [Coprobacillaceae bacterium]
MNKYSKVIGVAILSYMIMVAGCMILNIVNSSILDTSAATICITLVWTTVIASISKKQNNEN